MEKRTSVATTNLSEHILTDNSQGAGDNGVVLGGGSTFNFESSVESDSSEIALGAINRQAEVAGMALGTAVNAQTLAAHAVREMADGQALQVGLMDSTGQRWGDIFADAADVVNRSGAAIAGTASDAMFFNDRSLGRSLAFGEAALFSAENTSRDSLNFAADAMAESMRVSDRAVKASEQSLDSSLAFAKSSQAGTQNFVDDVLGGVFGLVKSVAADAREESAATRDFAGSFVGDFYESQKSGDVQTLQMIARYGAAVALVIGVVWMLRK